MTVIFSVAARTAKGTADLTSIGTDATLIIYSGTRPATPDASVPGGDVALVTFSMGTGVAFGTVASGVITANTIPPATVANSGTAVWARLLTSGGTAVVDFDVSTVAAGTGDIQLSTTTLTSGVTVTISSFTLTEN
jgi:hypothetical protein